jgi:hypothetical protein
VTPARPPINNPRTFAVRRPVNVYIT